MPIRSTRSTQGTPSPSGLSAGNGPESLCLLRLSAIGDCCHALPVLRTLQAAWPQTRFTWIIGQTEHRLMEGVEGVEFITFDKRNPRASRADIRRQLQGRRFPVLLHMHASMRANLLSRCIPAERRIGFDRGRARDWQWLYANERIAAHPRQHVMDGFFGFAEHLGISQRVLRWDIPLSEADKAFARQRRPQNGPLVLISPCSSQRKRNYRNWRVEHYAEVIAHLQQAYGARIILSGADTAIEKHYGRALEESAAGPLENLIGGTSLKQLLALIKEADLLICPDSGPAHMATAAGTPVVGLYATSNRWRTGPYLSQDLVVDRYPDAVEREFGKPVHDLRWGQRVRDPAAMDLITPAEVMARCDEVLRDRSAQ